MLSPYHPCPRSADAYFGLLHTRNIHTHVTGRYRYNSISWAVDVDEVFALGPATVDPRSGEILHSGIVFTDGWLNVWSRMFEIYGDSADASERCDKKTWSESDTHASARFLIPPFATFFRFVSVLRRTFLYFCKLQGTYSGVFEIYKLSSGAG